MQVAATGALSVGGCDWLTKHSQEELPHVQGQRPKLGGPHAQRAVAKRSYPTSEVGVAAESARLQRRRNGREKLPRAGGQGQRPGGTTLHPKNGGAVATRAQEGLEELCHMEGQEGWR